MYVCVLGRQPNISLAELEAVFGTENVTRLSQTIASVKTDRLDINQLGGTLKAGHLVKELPLGKNDKASLIAASHFITTHYAKKWHEVDHKITLGLSAYDVSINPKDLQKTGLILKSSLKESGVSLRLVPNTEPALSTAISHNNKLGLSANKVELIIAKTHNSIIIATSTGAQNITAYARRDRDRPRRDAFVGMLPPKLAQVMLNLATGSLERPSLILDPFCGTGTVLQEALLRGHSVIGSDLSDKMINYTTDNLAWLQQTHKSATGTIAQLTQADAMTYKWRDALKIDAVICETYLGQPFSAPPKPEKLREVVRNCDHIISEFLTNIRQQLRSNTPLCIAIPAWRDNSGNLTHLPLIRQLEKLGYAHERSPLIYARPDQVVAREIMVLTVLSEPKG